MGKGRNCQSNAVTNAGKEGECRDEGKAIGKGSRDLGGVSWRRWVWRLGVTSRGLEGWRRVQVGQAAPLGSASNELQ